MGAKFIEQGRVISVAGRTAWVELTTTAKCEQCDACQIMAAGSRGVEADNPVGAAVGDQVEVEICRAAKVSFPLLVFGLPVFLFIVGVILGSFLSELWSVAAGTVFLLAGMLIVKLADRYIAGQKRYNNVILKVLA